MWRFLVKPSSFFQCLLNPYYVEESIFTLIGRVKVPKKGSVFYLTGNP